MEIYVQGQKIVPECVSCGKILNKKQVRDYEINQFSYACSLECFEEGL